MSPALVGYSETEWADQMTQGEAEVGANAWRQTYGPMNRRGAVRDSSGLIHYRPGSLALRRIQADWSSFAIDEPYDGIAGKVVVVLADRNAGPVHDALNRLTSRRHLGAVRADSGHDIHIHQPQLVADLTHSLIATNSTDR